MTYYKNTKNEKYPRIPWFLYETLKYYEKPYWTVDYFYQEKKSEPTGLYFKKADQIYPFLPKCMYNELSEEEQKEYRELTIEQFNLVITALSINNTPFSFNRWWA